LMKRLYRGLLQQKLSPAGALGAAQLSIRKEARWAAPYYWAGFTVPGRIALASRKSEGGRRVQAELNVG
jgi:CHAT domain-containing protein